MQKVEQSRRGCSPSPLDGVLTARRIAGILGLGKTDCTKQKVSKTARSLENVHYYQPVIVLRNAASRPRSEGNKTLQKMWDDILGIETPSLTDHFILPPNQLVKSIACPEEPGSQIILALSDAAAAHTNAMVHKKIAAHLTLFFAKVDKNGVIDPEFSNLALVKLLADESSFSKKVASELQMLLSDAAFLMESELPQHNLNNSLSDVGFRMNLGHRTEEEGKNGYLGTAPQSSAIGHMMLVAQPKCERRPSVKTRITEEKVIKLIDPLSFIFDLEPVFSSIAEFTLKSMKIEDMPVVSPRRDGADIEFAQEIGFAEMLNFVGIFYAACNTLHALLTDYYETKIVKCAHQDVISSKYSVIIDSAARYGISSDTIDSLLAQTEQMEPSYAQLFDQEMSEDRNSISKNICDNEELIDRAKSRKAKYDRYNSETIASNKYKQKVRRYYLGLKNLMAGLKTAQRMNDSEAENKLVELIITRKKRLLRRKIALQARLNPLEYFKSLNAIFPRNKLPMTIAATGIVLDKEGKEPAKIKVLKFFLSGGRGPIEAQFMTHVQRQLPT